MDSIFSYKDYGRIVLSVKKVMDEKNVTVSDVVKLTGLHPRVVKRYYDGTALRFDKDVVSKLCFILGCNISDLMYYDNPNDKQ